MGFPMLAAVVWFLYILANLLQPEGLALGMGGLVMLSLAAWIFGRWGYNPEGSIRSRAKLAAFLVALVGVGGAASVVSRSDMQGGPTVQHEVGGLEWVNFSPAEVTRLRAEGKPVFIDFTAAWCVNCKLNEQGVLRNGQVVKAFQDQGVVTMKADWTRRDPVISQALREFGRTGVPFYVLYPKKGEPVLFPEILTTEGMLQALATANG
jgi:thiol:disulfide interchange protein